MSQTAWRINNRKPSFKAPKCCVLREWPVLGSCAAAIGKQAKIHSGPLAIMIIWSRSLVYINAKSTREYKFGALFAGK
jgi:hypothetical protein